jgi:hypothetical protein
MNILAFLIVGLLMFVTPNPASAETWQGQLKGGGAVRIDAQTHKPALYGGESVTPLWDGVHEMEDGSVVTVREGVAIPNETLYHSWSTENSLPANEQITPCTRLVQQTCGLQSECSARQPCIQAQQLEHAAADNLPANVTQECHKGLSDAKSFPMCEIKRGDIHNKACDHLIAQVCGNTQRCQKNPACDAARQLLRLEQESHLDGQDLAADTGINKQCQEALGNLFFSACQ